MGRAPSSESASLWSATAGPVPRAVTLGASLGCDVAVIGGGFTGLRAALSLAEAGTDVVLLEARHIAWGASGRNGGQVNPMLPLARPEDLRAAVGTAWFDRLAEVSLGSADALFALIRRHAIDCDARQRGWIRADHCAAARKGTQAAARLWNRHGADLEFAGGEDLARLTGSRSYGSAVVSRRGGAVHPLKLARGLAVAARRAGARLFESARVDSLERSAGRWHLRVASHEVSASAVIVATNGYTGALVPGLSRSILPLSSIQIATEPLPAARIGAVLPGGHTLSDTRRLICYTRREPDGRIVFGGMGYRLGGRLRGFRWLLADAPRVFPSLAGVSWRYRWGGEIALTEDRVPHLHEPARGLFMGLGYNGRGVALSHVMGAALAARARGTPAADVAFPTSSIRPMAGRRIRLFGLGLAMHAMRWRDRFDMR